MKRSVVVTATVATFVLIFTGCAESGPTVTATETSVPGPAVSGTASPTATAVESRDDRVARLRTVSQRVIGVLEVDPGRWVVSTSIADVSGDDDTSTEAKEAIAICEKAVELGADKVAVMESSGSTLALYDHPSYGNTCTIP